MEGHLKNNIEVLLGPRNLNPEKIKKCKGHSCNHSPKMQQPSLGSKLIVEISDEWIQMIGYLYTMQYFSAIKR